MTEEPTSRSQPSGRSKRIVGVLALVLGVVGSLVMVLLAVVVLRFGLGASNAVERAVEPIGAAAASIQTRIDDTATLIGEGANDASRRGEVRARVESLVDISAAAVQGYEALRDHPIYGLLPVDLAALEEATDSFQTSTSRIASTVNTAGDDGLASDATAVVLEQLDTMSGGVDRIEARLGGIANSLRTWIRLGSVVAFLGMLWGLWAQVTLGRRGWQGARGSGLRPPTL